MKVDVVVPTFNQSAMTVACARSLAANTDRGALRIIWVDNGSDPAERDITAKAWKASGLDVVAVTLPENLGFIKATNVGIAISTAPFVLLLNNDTEVPKGWLELLLAVMAEQPKAGIVGTRSSSPDDHAANREKAAPGYQILPPFSLVPFFCALIRREVIVQCGYLSEEYRSGLGDDNDYCRRVELAGWQLVRRLDLTIVHRFRTTFNAVYGGSAGWEPYQKENTALLRKKWGKPSHVAPAVAPAVHVSRPRTLAAIATQPGRPIEKVLRSLRPQVTRIHLVLNGYTEPPAIVQELADEWVCVPGNDDGAMAKFRWSNSWGGLYMSCDDDILYPPDYEAVMRRWVRRWRGKAIVTFHGRVLAPRARHVNDVLGEWVGCFLEQKTGRWINYPGSGVMGWDTRLNLPARYDEPLARNNEESFLSIWAQQNRVPIFAAPHSKTWLTCLNGPDSPALWKEEKADGWKRPNAVVVPWAKNKGWVVHEAR